jgi:hypothetical protein
LLAGDAGAALASERTPEDILLAARALEPEPVLTLEQRVGQASINEGLSGLLSRCGRDAPLSCASEAELIALGQASRAARGPRTRWETELAAARVTPTREHVAAITRLAEASVADFAIEYDSIRGTPGRMDQIGFVRRPLATDANSAVESWKAMLAAHGASLDALYGAHLADELQLVEQLPMGSLELLRFQRVVAGFPVESDTLDVLVTNEKAPLGPGVVWRIRSSWSTTASRLLAGLSRATLLSEAEAKRLVGLAPDEGRAQQRVRCDADRCVLTWFVDAAVDERFAIDAMTGEVVGPYDTKVDASGNVSVGTIRIGSGGAWSTSRLRGARFLRGATEIGNTDRTTGAYSNTAVVPWRMTLTGGTTTTGGAWMTGRVDRRTFDMSTIVEQSTSWNPTNFPNQNFGSPDMWPSSPTTLQHGTEVLYSWLTYWSDLFRTSGTGGATISQVADTTSFNVLPVLGPTAPSMYMLNSPVPGSGQSTWAQLLMSWPSDDGNPASSFWMGALGHEFGHTIQFCSATAGISCVDDNPGSGLLRPADWRDFRRQVWGAHKENLPGFLATVLTEWQDVYNGGSSYFNADFRYKGYLNTADSFGAILADSAGGVDCTQCGIDPTQCCPATTHICRAGTDESPHSNVGGICVRKCTSTAVECQPNENVFECMDYAPSPTGKVCWHNDYRNDWYTTVGTRLVFDSEWAPALRSILAAQAGSSGNYTRDFNLGTDSVYTTMADFGVDTLEVTRAVRSASSEPGVTSRDDFTDVGARALPITVTNVNGTSIQWGSGGSSYPQINSVADSDYVMFRGNLGASYVAEMAPIASPSLAGTVAIYRWTPSFTLITSATGAAGAFVSATTGGLPATDWYVVRFGGASGSGTYTARIKLASSTADDYLATNGEAYPLVTGVMQGGQLTAVDTDRFQIFVRTATSLSVATTGSPAPTVDVRNSAGTLLVTGTGSATLPSASAGAYYYVDVRDTTNVARSYGVTATLGCAGSNCDDLSGATTYPVRNAWGDRFGGRLPAGGSTASYTVTLQANENAVFSLADNSNTTCRLALDLIPPPALTYFNNQPAFRWNDLTWDNDPRADNGPAAGSRDGVRRGAGGAHHGTRHWHIHGEGAPVGSIGYVGLLLSTIHRPFDHF